jgi:peptidyl-prolyl cis-trans isomerase C
MTNTAWFAIVRRCGYLCGVVCVVVILGCGDDASRTNERVYATVNDILLTESALRERVPSDIFDILSPENKREVVREWVEQELLYQKALELGIESERDIARILDNVKRDLLVTEFLERSLLMNDDISESVLKTYYESHTDYFIRLSDEYSIRYASFDNLRDAQRFYNSVKRGATFSDLAEETSRDQSAVDGGKLGIVGEQSVEPSVWEAIVNTFETLGDGRISNPFNVIDGYGVVIIDGVYKRGTIRGFEQARDQVLDYYRLERREEEKTNLLRSLETAADVRFNL